MSSLTLLVFLAPLALAIEPSPTCGTLTGAQVHDDAGVSTRDLSWADGRLVKEARDGCPTYTLDGEVEVTAGLIALGGQIGLVEVSMEGGSRTDKLGDGRVRSDLTVLEAYSPYSSVVPVTRLGGITSTIVAPSGGFVSGWSSWVDLRTGSRAHATILQDAGLEVHLGGAARGLAEIRQLLEGARALRTTRGDARLLLASTLEHPARVYEPWDVIARSERPLVVHAERASDLEAIATFATNHRLQIIVVGASEGWLVADQLASAGVSVVLNPLIYGAGSFQQIHARPDNAARLAEAGVTVAISAGNTHNARSLRQLAGNAVREGLPHEVALRSITSVPADLYGSHDRGHLTVGQHADLAVWSGDPLEISSRLLMLVIEGEVQPLQSRQTELVETWRELPRQLHLTAESTSP